jgi:Na+/proline symporter/nitrogen-specific signal transduction histidine kinase
MSITIVVLCALAYLSVLFYIAFYSDELAEKGRSIANNPYIYALSMAVYCTAWTYYGSVGRASQSGIGFLPIYLGPTLFAPLFIFVLRKIILISKAQRISSIADFISSRYGKSTTLGVVVTLIALVGIIPYLALQLKAIVFSFNILVSDNHSTGNEFQFDTAFATTILLAIFTIIFGTRNIDPNERHDGMVSAIAFESLVKLLAFMAVGLFVTYGLYDGFEDLFNQAAVHEVTNKILNPDFSIIDSVSWFWLIVVSFLAILCLPRQFHISVVENISPHFVYKAMWVFPLYLLLINIFVLPIAFAGLIEFQGTNILADTFVLELPLVKGYPILALLAFIGGLSAATGMVIVETMAISIMLSNHIFLPFIVNRSIQNNRKKWFNFSSILLLIRRLNVVLIFILAYAYYKIIGTDYSLVSIGLISFVAVAQFAPSIIGGLYWKRGTEKGAIVGLILGFVIWAFTLPLPTLASTGLIDKSFIENGLFGVSLLKPYALFGLKGMDQISHSAFWSLTVNLLCYAGVSLYTQPSKLELAQADYFVDIYKYLDTNIDIEVFRRSARVTDLVYLLNKFLGEERSSFLLKNFENENKVNLQNLKTANADLVNYSETHLAGALGAASAKIIISSVVKEQQISFEELVNILTQTQEIMQYSKALEEKSNELEQTTQRLKTANEQLKELDTLKADFITTVTHELRTPITSIKSLSSIIRDYKDISEAKKEEYINIVVNECDRVVRLINQVLDLEKLPTLHEQIEKTEINIIEIIENAVNSLNYLFESKNIDCQIVTSYDIINVFGNKDKLTQIFVNLLSNAGKFCGSLDGNIRVTIFKSENKVVIKVADNGLGIPKDKQQFIFERFTQLSDHKMGKPTGSGLGLFITKKIVELHHGNISLESEVGKGATFIVKFEIL